MSAECDDQVAAAVAALGPPTAEDIRRVVLFQRSLRRSGADG